MFPSLHKISNKTVASNITNLLREFIPKQQTTLISYVTSRSLRRGATTLMQVHKDVTFSDSLARGGWSSGTNMDVYRVVNTAATLVGAKALSGWANARAPVFPPLLSVLGEHNRIHLERFMAELFPRSNIHLFGKGSALWPLLQTCTATMIMYHRDFVRDHKLSHPLVEKMNEAAENVFGGPVGHTYLNDWSRMLKDTFLLQNQLTAAGDDNTMEALNRVLAAMGQMQNGFVQLGTRFSDMEQSVNLYGQELHTCKQEMQSLKRQLLQQDGDAANPQPKRACRTTPAVAVQAPPPPAPAPQLRSVSEALKYKTSTTTPNQKASLISSLVIELYKNGQFHRGYSWQKASLAWVDKKEKTKLERAMTFAEKQASDLEKNSLCTRGLTEVNLAEIASSIEQKCLVELNRMEGKNKPDPTSRQRPTFLAIAQRLLKLSN
jgi:hypothetical protein